MDVFEKNNESNEDPADPFKAIRPSSISQILAKFVGYPEYEIWNLFRQGNTNAFAYIYFHYYPVLYNYGHQLSQDTALIEDCIQEVFFDIHKARLKLSNIYSMKSYLIKSLKTKYFRIVKKSSRTKENEKYYSGYEFQFTLSIEEKMINVQLNEELLAKLNMALESLTDRQREVMYYFYYENLTIDEISGIMGVTNRRTIQNIIYRAISYLRGHLDISTFILMLIIFGRTYIL